MTRLVLVGLPGTGKSEVARVLASQWGVEALDTDDVVRDATGETPAEIIRTRGEDAFRDLEETALGSCLERDAVVATGGGIVERAVNRAALAHELTVWLDAPDDVILLRLIAGDRPLLGEDPRRALALLRARRLDWYAQVARVRVDASGTPGEVASAVRRGMMSA